MEIGSLITVVDLIFNFLKGGYIPLYFFPVMMIRFLELTPIPYLIAYPIDLYTGQVQVGDAGKPLLILSMWLLLSVAIAKYAYKKGLKRYEAFGA